MSHTATCALDPHHSHKGHDHAQDDGHSHGLVDHSIVRSRAGLRAVALTLAILAVTAVIQAAIYIATAPKASYRYDSMTVPLALIR